MTENTFSVERATVGRSRVDWIRDKLGEMFDTSPLPDPLPIPLPEPLSADCAKQPLAIQKRRRAMSKSFPPGFVPAGKAANDRLILELSERRRYWPKDL